MVLISHWPLHEDSGSTAYDVRSNYDGSITGATVGKTGILGTTSYSLDGTDDTVDVSNLESTSELTFFAWVKTSASSGRQYAVGIGDQTGGNNLWILTDSGDYASRTNGSNSISSTGATIADGTWTHVGTTVASDGTVTDYVNGQQVYQYTVSSVDFSNLGTEPLQIGNRSDSYSGRFWNGNVADVRAYNHAISAQEVQYLYDAVQVGNYTTSTKSL